MPILVELSRLSVFLNVDLSCLLELVDRSVDDSGGCLQSIQGGRSGESRETGSHRQKVSAQLVVVSG